ncbi:hypothetical protein [uncultured Thiothrix sp.]|jgi:hypothetical protein|uniref:hypothetical protein n=1 Tax=uncultured Thiothrix sp. TaxID=223185 RepID=UPI00261F197A|nr:hypothetical protein [uncultured Thiothrix sp.]HMT93475.1 hypothetical protein [Thiolinea sp.]
MDTTAERQDISRYTIPLSESKAKEWIDSLSMTDFGDTTKRVYHGLADLNRRSLSPVVRIRIGERLRPIFDLMLKNLNRHLSCRAFPLPERGQRIFDLNQSLLLEFSGLYQLAALDMITRDEVSKRALQITIYRVLDYLGLYLMSTYSVYVRTRESIWHDIHHMYLLASERGLDKARLSEGREGASSIEERYIQLNVLPLFKPYSLRQEEIVRIARYVESITHLIKVSNEPLHSDANQNFVHAAMLNNAEPAVIMPYRDLPHSPTVRVFNLAPVILDLDRQIQEISQEQSSGLILKNGLSRNLLKRMVFHLTIIRNRQFNRFPKQEKMAVVLGMQSILEVLYQAYHGSSSDQKREEDILFDNMLYGEASLVTGSKRNVDETTNNMQIWDLINSSVGGYGLRWTHKESSAIRVGELIGLRDISHDENTWVVGVVKWMEYINKQGLFCGIELLSTKVQALKATAVVNREVTNKFPQQGLMLPSVDGLREDPVLILPSYIFQSGDKLIIDLQGREEQVVLSSLDECLGAFAYFRYKILTEEDKKPPEDDFGSLWLDL